MKGVIFSVLMNSLEDAEAFTGPAPAPGSGPV